MFRILFQHKMENDSKVWVTDDPPPSYKEAMQDSVVSIQPPSKSSHNVMNVPAQHKKHENASKTLKLLRNSEIFEISPKLKNICLS